MPNPIKSIMSANMPNMNTYRQAYQLLKNRGNPMALMQSMAQSKPELKPIFDAISKGTSPQQIFNNLCQQKGIDANEFIKNITG